MVLFYRYHRSFKRQARRTSRSASLPFKRLELGGAPRALDHELVAWLGLHDAGIDHLRHQVCGHLARLILLLQGEHLLLELVNHGELGLDIGFFLGRGLLLLLDLF